MMLLGIDTCGPTGSVALGRVESFSGGSRVAVVGFIRISARGSSAELVPKIQRLLSESGAAIRDIEAIVVVSGPGSFTGIRVGLSTAKGLAQAVEVPLIALSRLRLLADLSGHSHVVAAFEAGRGEYYAGEYVRGGMLWEKLLDRCELNAAADESDGRRMVLGGGMPGSLDARRPIPARFPDATDALRSSLRFLLDQEFADLEALDGNYLRHSERELFGAADVRPATRLPHSPSNHSAG